MNRVLQQLRRAALLGSGGGLSDGDLLERFLARREEAAFEALVRRHGPVVLGVCRRVLGDPHDAEDAFQATFLVLVRKAASIQARELVGHWLYRVAYLTALKARTLAAKRRRREEPVRDVPQPEPPPEQGWLELLPVLDRELNALPEKYRIPVVLCDLEGRPRREVARRLGCPEGTLSWRLAHARKLLARRLARYGPAVSGVSLAAALSPGAASAGVPAPLVMATTKAALGRMAVAARVVALTEGVVKAMFLTKLKGFWAVALAVLVGVGAIGLAYRPAGAQSGPQPAQPESPRRAAQAARVADELEELRLEVAALRKGLEATRARVKSLENEVQTLRQGRTTTGRPQQGATPRGVKDWYREFWRTTTGRPQQGATPRGVKDWYREFWRTTTGRPQQGATGNFTGQAMGSMMKPGRFGAMKGAMPGAGIAEPSKGGKMPGPGPAMGSSMFQAGPAPVMKGSADPLAQAEAALKKLRRNPQDKQAAAAVERALQWLRKQSGRKPAPDPLLEKAVPVDPNKVRPVPES